MATPLRLLLAQLNPIVGAISSNAQKIKETILKYQKDHDLILFPELGITGYPPEDLLLRQDFYDQVEKELEEIAKITEKNCYVILGHPSKEGDFCFNSASVYHQGKRIGLYHKQKLPNYGVFDEARYFTKGQQHPCTITIKDYKFGLCICEDIWQKNPVEQLIAAGIEGLLVINASPFDEIKYEKREILLKAYAKQNIDIIYLNLVGGQDELIFDGHSLAIDRKGEIRARLPAFVEAFETVRITKQTLSGPITPLISKEQLIYEALVLGTKDYIEKNGFPGVLLGLSGGIDSALTLAIAVDALGPKRVHAVLMPSRYTLPMSMEDALTLVENLQVSSTILSIEETFESILHTLTPAFANYAPDTTEENIQARIRGTFLMALSNKTKNLVLTTSNKSESAVGYTTLYGDMAGGFAVLKDVMKTQVYALVQYRNQQAPIIPQRIITRPPSAELAVNQTDQDHLPPYADLDAIIYAYMEENKSAKEIIEQGYHASAVHQVIKLIKLNEYKRRQAPPGIKISTRAFGKDWRLPITSGFKNE